MNKAQKTDVARRAGNGFSLIEVLIALVIMSVGMLGIAGLYMHSMQAGRSSIFRHQAVTLAGDIADRIRANPRAGVAYMAAGVDFNCVGGGIDCSPAEMAQNDILLWDQQAAGSLPNGTVNIVFVDGGTAPDSYQITVTWDEAGQNPPPQYRLTIPVAGI